MVLIKNTMEFSGVIKKKIMWNFPGVLVVLDLKISDGPNKFCGVSRVGASFLTGISRGNIKNLNIPKWFSKKYVLNPPSPVCIFLWNSPTGSTRPKFHSFISSSHLNLLLNSKGNKIIVPKASILEVLVLKKITITS